MFLCLNVRLTVRILSPSPQRSAFRGLARMNFPTFLIISVFACIQLAGAASDCSAQELLITDSEVRLANFESDVATQKAEPLRDTPLSLDAESPKLFDESPDPDPQEGLLEILEANGETAQWQVVSGTLRAIVGVGMIALASIGVVIYRKRTLNMRRRQGYF